MSENQGRSIWDVFSDVKPDSYGTGLNQPPVNPSKKEQVGPSASAANIVEENNYSLKPSGKGTKKKSERTPDSVKRASDSSRQVIPSLKLTAIRNKLKLSNGASVNKSPRAEKKPKSYQRQRKNSVTPSPTKKSPKVKTLNRKLTSPNNLVGSADLQLNLGDCLTRKSNTVAEAKELTPVDESTKPTLISLPLATPGAESEQLENVTSDSRVIDHDPSNQTLNVALKVSKREKRRPVKYSPELSRPTSGRGKNKTPDSAKEITNSKTRRRVDFSDSPTNDERKKDKEIIDISKNRPVESVQDIEPQKSDCANSENSDHKEEANGRDFQEKVKQVKNNVKPCNEVSSQSGSSRSRESSGDTELTRNGSPVFPERTKGTCVLKNSHSDIDSDVCTPPGSMVVPCDDTNVNEHRLAARIEKDTPDPEQGGKISSSEQITVDHTTPPPPETAMTAMPPVLTSSILERTELVCHENVRVQNIHRTLWPNGRRSKPNNKVDKQLDIAQDGPPKQLPGLLPITVTGLAEPSIRGRDSPRTDYDQAERPVSPFVCSKPVSPSLSSMMVPEVRSVESPASIAAADDDCAPLDLSRGKKRDVEFINLDEPLDLTVKKKALNPPAVTAPFYEDPNKDVPIPFSGASISCNRVAPMIHRTPSQRNIFESRNQTHIRKVSPVRPHIAGKPVVRDTSYGAGGYSLNKTTSNALTSKVKNAATGVSSFCGVVNSKGMVTQPNYGDVKHNKNVPDRHSVHTHEDRLRANSPFAQAHAALLSGGTVINTSKESASPRARSPAGRSLSSVSLAAPVLNVPTYHQRTKEESRKAKKTSEPLRIAIPGDSVYEAPRNSSIPTAQVKPNNTMNIVGEVSINLDRAAPATVTIHGGLAGSKPQHKKTARKSTRGEMSSNFDKRLLQQMLEGTSPPKLTVVSPPKSSTSDSDIAAQNPMPSPQMPVLSPHSSQNQSPSGSMAKDYPEPIEKHSPALPSTMAALRKVCSASSRETTPTLDSSVNLTQIEKIKHEKARELLNSNSALASLLVSEAIKPIIGVEIKQEPSDHADTSEAIMPDFSSATSPKIRSRKTLKSAKAKTAKCQVAKELLDKCTYPSAFAPVSKFSRKALQKSKRSFFTGFAFNFKKVEEKKRKYDVGKSSYYQCHILGKQPKDVNEINNTKNSCPASPVNPYSKVSYLVPDKGDDYVPSFDLPFSDWRDHLFKYKREKLKMPTKLVYVPTKGNTPKKFEDFTTLISATPAQGCHSKRKLSTAQFVESENVNSHVLSAIKKECPTTRKFGVIVERRAWLLEERGDLTASDERLGKKLKRKSESSTDSTPVKRSKITEKSPEKSGSPDGDKPRIFLKIANGKIINSCVPEKTCSEPKESHDAASVTSSESPTKKGTRGPYKQRYSRVRLEETYPQHMEELKTFRMGGDSEEVPSETMVEVCPPPREMLVTLEDATNAIEAFRPDLIPHVPTSSQLNDSTGTTLPGSTSCPSTPNTIISSNNIIPHGTKGELSSTPRKQDDDNALASLVRRVKCQILGQVSEELMKKKKTQIRSCRSPVVINKNKLSPCTVVLTRDTLPEAPKSPKTLESKKDESTVSIAGRKKKPRPCTSSSPNDSPRRLARDLAQKIKKVSPARKDRKSLSPLKSLSDHCQSPRNSRSSSPVKSSALSPRKLIRSPRRGMDKGLSKSPSRGGSLWKSPRKRAAEAAKARKKKRRSILDELANSEGYVADKQMKKGGENLYADPSKLGREERALQRALMQFSEMQLKNELGKEKKRVPKVAPPPHSQARQKARQLKKKAMLGSNKSAMSRPTRRPIEFRPQRPTTRLQAAAVEGRRKLERMYHKDDAYEQALNKDEQRRRQSRVKKRSKLLMNQLSVDGDCGDFEKAEPSGQVADDHHETTEDDDLPVIKPAKRKKALGFIFDWRSKYLGKSPKGKSIKNSKGVKAKNSLRASSPPENNTQNDSCNVYLGAKDRASSEEEYDSDSTVSYEDSSAEEEEEKNTANECYEETCNGVPEDKLDIPLEVKKLNICHNTGETILHKAARLGYEDVVLWCSQHNYVEVKARDNAGYSALHESCVPGHLKVARYLLEYGADVNVASRLDGVRPLHDAVENDHTELVRLLLSAGADPTLSTYSGKSILKLARTRDLRQFLQAYLMDLNGPTEMERETVWDFEFVSKDPEVSASQCAENEPTSDKSECGCDVLADLPSDDEDDANLLEFEFSEELPIQSYLLCVDEKKGPENYLVLSDVIYRLKVSDYRLCSLHGSLHIEHITWNEFCTQLEMSQLAMEPREDIRPLDSNEMMDFVKLDRKLQQLLGMDVDTCSVQDIHEENGHDIAADDKTLNVSICSEDLEGIGGDSCLPSPNDSIPPLGSYISRTASGDQSIKRAGPLPEQQELAYDSVPPTPGVGVIKEATTPEECFAQYHATRSETSMDTCME